MADPRVPALMLAALALGNRALAADVVVGNGQPGSCTEFALNSAVAVVNSSGGCDACQELRDSRCWHLEPHRCHLA